MEVYLLVAAEKQLCDLKIYKLFCNTQYEYNTYANDIWLVRSQSYFQINMCIYSIQMERQSSTFV